MRRIASHYLLFPDGSRLSHQVIELSDGIVTGYYPLMSEQECTEWLPGLIELSDNLQGEMIAFWCYPFDLSAMKPVDGTLRTRLL